MMYARPRIETIMPSVAMNGGTSSFEMNRPFTMPNAAPSTHISSAASTGFIVYFVISSAAPTPAKPATEPQDRSMPPVSMMNVMPTAMMPTMDTWRRTLKMLDELRKRPCGIDTAKQTMRSRRIRIMP